MSTVDKSEIETQLGFLQKDREQVQLRLDQVLEETETLKRTLGNLDGAIQVSNHYINMCDNKENDGTSESSKSEKKDKKWILMI